MAGYNPFGYNFGFIYDGANMRTVAHELGHGIGSLRHPFDETVAVKGQTDNLMDYNDREQLWHFQWDMMQKPPKRIFKWRFEEGDAEEVNFALLKWVKIANESGRFYFTPSGKPLYLSDLDSVAVVVNSESGISTEYLFTSAIYGFVHKNTRYFADYSEFNNGGVVTRYFNGFVKTGTYVNQKFISVSSESPASYYTDGTEKTRKYAEEIYSKGQIPELSMFNYKLSDWDIVYPSSRNWIPSQNENYRAEGLLSSGMDKEQYLKPKSKPQNVDYRYLKTHERLVFNRNTREVVLVFDIPEDNFIDFKGKKIHIKNLNRYNIDTMRFADFCASDWGWMVKERPVERYAILKSSNGHVWHIDYEIKGSSGILWTANYEYGLSLGIGFDEENVAFYGNMKWIAGFGSSRINFEDIVDKLCNHLIGSKIVSDDSDWPSLSMGASVSAGFNIIWDWGYESAKDLFGSAWTFDVPLSPVTLEFNSGEKCVGVGVSLPPSIEERVTNLKFSHDFAKGVLCHNTESELVMKMILGIDDPSFTKKPTSEIKDSVSCFWGVDDRGYLFYAGGFNVVYSNIKARKSDEGPFYITVEAENTYLNPKKK